MSDRLRHRLTRARGWFIPAALLALTPKCLLCVLAYAGLGAALGFGGPELCGATGDPAGHWGAWLPALAAATGMIGVLVHRTRSKSS